jgi:hypothetical protein
MYYEGKGVPQNHVEAAKWFRLAADQGNADAQYNLGVAYANGQGVPQNYAEAYVWSSLSAAQGNENAAKNRELISNRLPAEALLNAQQRSAELSAEIEARKSQNQ